ncbi:hypothetical protein MRX96_025893 [Rhipicephalus microplus]
MYVPRNKKRNFVVVPWYNRHEWEKTYRNLFSDSLKDQAAGLGVVAAWRSRLYGHLPRAIESTAALVQAQLSESRSRLHNDSLNAEELSCLYAVAIVRFVGDIVEPVRSVKNITTKEAAFQKRKCTRREMAELKVKRQACLDQIAACLEEDSDLVVDMLVLGGDYLLPSRESLDELCPNMRLSLPSSTDGLPCRLPRLLADRWDPLLATLDSHTLQKLAERLLSQPHSTRHSEGDQSLRHYLSVAWLGHLLTGRHEHISRAGNGSDRNSSPSQLNVIRLLKAAMDYPMEYSTKAITVLSQHMWPPLGEAELGHLTALAAIQGGLMLGHRWDTMDSAEEDTGGDGSYMPYTVEDFQDAEDGFDETAWKLPQTSMEWSLTPVGQLPGFPADRLDLNLDFKELRPVGAARLEDTGLSLEQASAEASVNTEETELPTLADQLDRIRQNLQLFLV